MLVFVGLWSGSVAFYSVWHSLLRVREVLLFCWISLPCQIWYPGLRFIWCFHRYRASPHIRIKDPGVRSTGIFAGLSFFMSSSASTEVKCIMHDDSREIIAIPSSKRIRSTCARIPYTLKGCIRKKEKNRRLQKLSLRRERTIVQL